MTTRYVYVEHRAGGPIERFEVTTEDERAVWYRHPSYKSLSRIDIADSRVWGWTRAEALKKKRQRLASEMERAQGRLASIAKELEDVDDQLASEEAPEV